MGEHETRIIDGKASAARLKDAVKAQVATHVDAGHRVPGLCTFLVGDDPASDVYVRHKRNDAGFVGFSDVHQKLPADISEEALLDLIREMNRRDDVDGILVQLPLPKHIDRARVLNAILPSKDVDGFHPVNVAGLVLGQPSHWPCTPKGCLHLLDELGVELRGKHAVVVGHSNIVGRPMASLLVQRDCTVTICHIHTQDLAQHTRQADILVVATGCAGLISADMVKDGVVVLDVGISRTDDGKLTGDVQFDDVKPKAAAITPVPGGVGPMTRAMLLQNTLEAYEGHLRLPAEA